MPRRDGVVAVTVARPRNADEVQLEEAQKAVTKGLMAEQVKRELVLKLWRGGMTQAEIAERLSRASEAVGGPKISVNAVNKVAWKFARKLETANS